MVGIEQEIGIFVAKYYKDTQKTLDILVGIFEGFYFVVLQQFSFDKFFEERYIDRPFACLFGVGYWFAYDKLWFAMNNENGILRDIFGNNGGCDSPKIVFVMADVAFNIF